MALALVGAPLGASAQAPVVQIATTTCASGALGVQVGDTCYAAPVLPPPPGGGSALGGLQVLVLSRSTLALISNQGLTTNVGSPFANCQQQNTVVGPALAKLTSAANLVILSSVGAPAIAPTGGECLQRAVLGQAIYALGGFLGGTANPIKANVAYSLVGIPGLGQGNGGESVPTTASVPAGLTGYLAQDVHANYAFLPGSGAR